MSDVRDPKTGQLIYPGYQRGPGLHNATSYQVSAIPFLTGNILAPPASRIANCIHLPSVASWIKVDNLDHLHEIRVGFSEFGVASSGSFGGNYMIVQSATGSWNTTGQLPYKVRKIFIKSHNENAMAQCQIICGLTHINHDLSASAGLNWSGSAGVG